MSSPSGEKGPVCIGGLDRCGKTTMRAFLASHPNISIPAVGSNMWTYFYARFGDLADDGNLERCLAEMLAYKHVRFLEPDPDRIRREFAAGPRTYGRLFELFLRHHAEAEGKPRWGDQTGLIERYADQVVEAYAGVRIIHMIRDPRDRYEASISKWPDGKGRAGGAAARFLYSTSLARRNERRHPDAYLVVRFEDLVHRTEAVLREVCEFVGEEYLPELLDMPGAEKHRDMLRSGNEAGSGNGNGGLLSPEHIGRFRGRVPDNELAFLQFATGRRMAAYGYEREPLGFDTATKLRFAAFDVPNGLARLAAWSVVELGQQRLPTIVPRRYGARMRVDDSYRPKQREQGVS